jgi:predicted NBD/HSP70 family sugar kinase
MTTLLRGNRDLIKAMNRNLILNTLRRHDAALSRTQLTGLTGLSVGAVSQITGELLEQGWILESGESDYTGGRRQVLLRLNPEAAWAAGVKLMENRVVCAITDLESQVVYYTERETANNRDPRVVGSTLAQLVEESIDQAGIPRSKLLGAGIGLAGVIEPQTGLVHYSPFFDWHDISLVEMVSERLHLPVYIENDVNTLTITEQLFGGGRQLANFAVITIGRGIGMGVVMNHQLYQGAKGGVGELGHVTLDPDGPRCDCGKRGCLEALAADPAVVRAVEEAIHAGTPTSIRPPVTMTAVVAAARSGDALARQVLANSGALLGQGIAIVINLLAPSLIILSGEGVSAGDDRLQPMFAALRQHVFDGLLDSVQVIVEPTDDRAWARGAASLVISKVFESPLVEG